MRDQLQQNVLIDRLTGNLTIILSKTEAKNFSITPRTTVSN